MSAFPSSLPMPMLLFSKYFWLIAVFVMLINAMMRKSYMKKINKNNMRQKALMNLYFISMIPFFFLWVFQQLGNFQDCSYIISGDFSNIWFITAWVVIVGTWIFAAWYFFAKIKDKNFFKMN